MPRRALLRSCSMRRRRRMLRTGGAFLTFGRRVSSIIWQPGTTCRSLKSRARYELGLSPMICVNRAENDPRLVAPTATHTSVTDMSPRRKSAVARSIRRVMRYEYGVSPYASRKRRLKCAVDMNAVRASDSTSSGSAYSRSIRSRARRRRRSSSRSTDGMFPLCAAPVESTPPEMVAALPLPLPTPPMR